MRHVGTLVGSAALVLLAAGCAGSRTGAVGAASAPTLSTSTSAPTSGQNLPSVHIPPGAVPVAGSRVNATALPPSYPRLVWIEGDGRTVGLFGQQGGCDTVSAQVAAQNATQVVIRLIRHEPASPRPCPMYLRDKEMTVTLDQPLGSREVVLQQSVERG